MKEMDSQSKLSLKLQAYQYLKTKILNCEYPPQRISERAEALRRDGQHQPHPHA